MNTELRVILVIDPTSKDSSSGSSFSIIILKPKLFMDSNMLSQLDKSILCLLQTIVVTPSNRSILWKYLSFLLNPIFEIEVNGKI